MTVVRSGFGDVTLLKVKQGITAVTATAGQSEVVVEVEHGLDERPLIEFMQSFDGGKTYVTRYPGVGFAEFFNFVLQGYTDSQKLYFHFYHATGSFDDTTTVHVNWKLYLTV